MKKILSLIALAMTIGMTSCSDDECDHKNESGSESVVSIVGSWYDEIFNEEMRFSENGTFYDRFANYQRCAEVEGRWEFDSKNNKLTYNYPDMGHTQFVDWTVKNLKELSFTISSSKNGDHNLEKIVESYDLQVAKTATIEFSKTHPDYSVTSYTSNNERIASVTSDGVIKAEGEKGITYIKVSTTKTNVWVKVTVGDNCSDMWFDYVGLMGLDYSNMRKALSSLGDPYSGDDGYSFGFIHQQHDVIEITKVFMCPSCSGGMVTEVQLLLKESVSEAEILSYMKSRYYKMSETDSYIFYSSVEDPEQSKAIIAYNKSEKSVIFAETQHLLHNPHVVDLWTDFVPLFGRNKNQVKSAMDEYGYSFLMSNFSYSKDGSDYYAITNNQYAQMVGFVFNPDKQVSEFWVYMGTKYDANDVYKYLCTKYKENKSESSQYELVFYNDDKSMKVTFDLMNAAVVYTKLTMKQHEANHDILGNYYEGLGMTRDQIVAQYGTPYSDDGSVMDYIVGTDYVNLAWFYMNTKTNKCKTAVVSINENVATSTIVEFLNSKYTVFAKETASDGSKYAWTNGPSVAESTLGIVYIPKDRLVIYQPLGSVANTKAMSRAISSIISDTEFIDKTKLKTSSILNAKKKIKESIEKHRTQQLQKVFENYNK